GLILGEQWPSQLSDGGSGLLASSMSAFCKRSSVNVRFALKAWADTTLNSAEWSRAAGSHKTADQRQSKEEGSKMTRSPAAQTNGSGRGMLLRFLVLGGLLLTSQGMAIAQDPLPHTSLKAYIVDLKASIQQHAGLQSNAFIAPPADQLDGFRLTMSSCSWATSRARSTDWMA